jgi:predicted RNase H-like HicB family nuclease
MPCKYTIQIELDEEWFIATSIEIPGANGQGHTLEECLMNFADAISLLEKDRNAD